MFNNKARHKESHVAQPITSLVNIYKSHFVGSHKILHLFYGAIFLALLHLQWHKLIKVNFSLECNLNKKERAEIRHLFLVLEIVLTQFTLPMCSIIQLKFCMLVAFL